MFLKVYFLYFFYTFVTIMSSLLAYLSETEIEAGCDEAGRGCLAGGVFAAAVILPKDFYHPLLNDSKKLTAKQREQLRPIIPDLAILSASDRYDPGPVPPPVPL